MSAQHFNSSHDTYRSDIIVDPWGLLIVVHWSNRFHTIGRSLVLPIPELPGPVSAYKSLLAESPTTNPNQLLLTVTKGRNQGVVTTPMLSQALRVFFRGLTDGYIFVLSSHLEDGGRGVTSAYRACMDQLHINRLGIWASKAF